MRKHLSQPDAQSRSLKGFKKALFVSLLVLLPMCFLELVSALYLNVLSADPRPLATRNIAWHVYHPYRNHALGPGWNSKGRIHNQAGFRRTTEVSQIKPVNGYRVFLMGGSAAYGISSAPPFPSVVITNTQTIDYKLERLLHELFPEIQIEVINAGVTAYWTHHNLIYLHETILDYNPDLVIFLDGINDYYHTRPDHRQFSSYKFSLTLKTNDLNHPTPMAALQSFLGWGKEYSHALFIANDAADRLFGWSRAPDDPCNLESIRPEQLTKQFREQYEAISRRTWVRTLRTILMSLKDQRIAAITTLQPELIFTQTKGMSEADLRLHAMELAIRPPYYKEKKEFLKPVTVRLAQESASQFGATLVDLTDLFDSHEQYFIDYCHLTEAGAQRIAETLLPHVTAQIAAQHKSQLQSSLYYSAPRLPQ